MVTLNVELSHDRPGDFLNETVNEWLRKNAEPTGARANVPYRIISASILVHPDDMESIVVSDEGESVAAALPNQPAGNAPGFGSGRAGAPTPPRSRGPSVTNSGGGNGSGALRQTTPGAGAAAPGADVGVDARGTGGGGGETVTNAPPPGIPISPMNPINPGAGQGGAGAGDLNAMAPPPTKPRLYPTGATYYLVPITFEVELIDPNAPAPAPGATADAANSGGVS
jgi:hypothetical protein